jgi:phage terminase large subunit GpA-like protein
MGIDTHDTCLYANTMGFSSDLKKIYGLRYDILVGDPNEADVWKQFYNLFNSVYTRCDGVEIMPVFAFCDSGGHRTNAVYMQEYKSKRFLPVKGYVSSKQGAVDPLLGKLQKFNLNAGIKGKALVQMVGVNAGKDTLNSFEVLTVAGEQHLYFPKGCGYDVEFFKGLLSEKRINGRWIAPQGSHTANEPIDTCVYALACAHYYYQKYWITGKDKESLKVMKITKGDKIMKKNEEVKPEVNSAEEAPKKKVRKTRKEAVELPPIDKKNEEVKPEINPEVPKKKYRRL